MTKRIICTFLCCVIFITAAAFPVLAAPASFEKTDNIGQNMINAALAQMGKKNADFVSDGMPKDQWCAYFIVWLSRVSGAGKAGILPNKYSGYGQVGKLAEFTLKKNKGTFTCFHESTYNYTLEKLNYGNRSNVVMESIANYTPQPGDLIFFRWKKSNVRFGNHVALVYKVSGSKVYYIDGNGSCEGTFSYARSYVDTHSKSLKDSEIAAYLRPNYDGKVIETPKPVITTCRYRVTIPANYKLQCYETAESTAKYKVIAAQSNSYNITCTKKVAFATGDVRYFFKSGDGYDLYFDFTDKMSVTQLHDFQKTVHAPNCSAQGYTTRTCACGYSDTVDYVEAKGHDYQFGAVTQQPTCTTAGTRFGVCSLCNDMTIEQIPATGHSFVNGTCSACGLKDASQETAKVVRIYGAERYATSLKAADVLKKELGVSKFDCIVVASGTAFADALSGSYLAAAKKAPMLLVRNNKTTIAQVKEYITKNLKPGGTVYLLGGENAVPKTMETGLTGFSVKRLGGATRYDTNLIILNEAGVAGKDILVCTGKGFADSLSASAVGLPILLVKDSLSDAQKAFLKGTTGKKYVIGGASAVPTQIEEALKAYGEVKRLGGRTRYETSVAVAMALFKDVDEMVVAYAKNFPDGLSGGALAAGMKVPLILVSDGNELSAYAYAQVKDVHTGYVLGGPTLISDKTCKAIYCVTPVNGE